MATTDRPRFYYAQGTSYGLNVQLWGQNIFTLGANGPVNRWIKGVNNDFYYWGSFPNDVFPDLLSSTLWETKRVPFPASGIFIGPSIEVGVEWVIADILTTPVGTPFAMGGYSQGAAVMSRVYQETRSGRLTDRRHDLRAMVTFGNPMREAGHTYPGSSGYSGSDTVGDTTGGHGTFPSAEMCALLPYVKRFARLQDTDSFIWDFTMPNEVISGVGDSADGIFLQLQTMIGLQPVPVLALLGLPKMGDLWSLFGQGLENGLVRAQRLIRGVVQDTTGLIQVIDPKTGDVGYIPGGGHAMYPSFPPPNADGSIPSSGDTCYQIAARYINTVGAQIYDQMHPTVPAPTTRPTYQWFTSLVNG